MKLEMKVLKYYRPATKEDFEIIPLPSNFPQEVIDFINKGEMIKAYGALRNLTGLDIFTSKDICNGFRIYQKARYDFETGKQVFVEYK